ncbi:hypothetical protein An04g09780 [Aspergillus niger]|uniref:Secreted protein n=2 Tax=Aspergillus niger TaxID=5061 RepID=A2QK91_ASPNC|nr:hypothetical protein An04g09780 [Aspergillus niger]CAK39037.1 hypothetical protein An04g09780 [Aspergillus niger]
MSSSGFFFGVVCCLFMLIGHEFPAQTASPRSRGPHMATCSISRCLLVDRRAEVRCRLVCYQICTAYHNSPAPVLQW